jgi:tetratricopeptide (TPR) repeat protein
MLHRQARLRTDGARGPVNAIDDRRAMSQALALVQRGDGRAALTILSPLLDRHPADADLLHLLGLAHKAAGDLDAAAGALRRALDITPRQPAILNNLGNVLRARGELDGAERCYRAALDASGDYADARRNLGILLIDQARPAEARALLEGLVRAAPRDVKALNALGAACRDLDDLADAIDAFERAVALQPDYVNAVHNLGLAYRLSERHAEAIACYRRALALAPAMKEIHYNLGNAQLDLGDFEAAEASWLRAIELQPDYVDAHVTLNEFYWQRGRTDRYARSFELAARAGRLDTALAGAWIRSLVLAGRDEEAEALIARSVRTLGDAPALLRWEARIARRQGDLVRARDALLRALRTAGSPRTRRDPAAAGPGTSAETAARQDLVEVLLMLGDVERAGAALQELLAEDPDDQRSWALQDTCWRIAGDERHEWLHDGGAFVQVSELPVPAGYDSLAAFLSSLAGVLREMHRFDVQPLEQTLNHGTQTPGRLLHKPAPQLQALRRSFAQVVQGYIDSLGTDPAHPFLRRNTRAFRFSGSWSVRLRPGGHHVSHVHPAGWISSAFYVELPSSVGPDDPDRRGWIQFGKSSLALDVPDEPFHFECPAAGRLVLFPSYTWHGTVPFDGHPEDSRMTAPFDAVPA